MKAKHLIHIIGLQVKCIIGIHDAERRRPQSIEVDVEVALKPLKLKSVTDCQGTLDWEQLSHGIKALLTKEKYYLAEQAALGVADLILAHPLAKSAQVKIRKFEAIPGVKAVVAEVIKSK